MRRACWPILQFLLVAAATACTASESPTSPPVALAQLSSAAGHSVEVLEVRSFTLDDRRWLVVLARVDRPDGGRTYVQWMPPDKPGPRPLVVVTAPYQIVDWTGEEVDSRWAGYAPSPSGLYLDRDGPGFDGKAEIYAEHKTPEQTASESIPHLINDAGVLVVFGRFYAGGSVRDEVADMAAGMWLAPRLPQADPTRVGVWGGSWGGFEALWAAREAEAELPARAVAALYPVSDFPGLVTRAANATGVFATLFPAYLRRVYAATGGPPWQPGTDYQGLRTEDLCGRLPETLVLHDDGDTIIPVAHTEALAARCGVAPLYWPRLTPGDSTVWTHGPLLDGPTPQAVTLYSLAFLHLRLAPPEQPFVIELYSEASLGDHLQLLRQAQLAGRDISYAVPRLYDLMDPRLWLWDPSTCAATGCPIEPGAVVIGRWYQRLWGETSSAKAAVLGALAR